MVAYNLTVTERVINMISFSYLEVAILVLLILLPLFAIMLFKKFKYAFVLVIISYIINNFYIGYLLTKLSLLIRIVDEIDIATQLSNLLLYVTAISTYFNLIYFALFVVIALLWVLDYFELFNRK